MLAATLLFAALQLSDSAVIGEWNSYVLRQRWNFAVRQSDLERSPSWSEFFEDPPLAPRRAIQAAQFRLERLVADANAWRLGAIQLEHVGGPDRWVYVVEFREPQIDGQVDGVRSSMRIVVLMDGHAIEPTRHPWPEPANK